jgi:WD40 repeat protein
VPTGKERRPFTLPSVARSLALSTDGRVLAAGCSDGGIRLWDLAAGKELPQRRGHRGAVTGLALSADGRLMVSASATVLVFMPQSRSVGLFGGDSTALTWDMDVVRRADRSGETCRR